jgi:hypothetical protein
VNIPTRHEPTTRATDDPSFLSDHLERVILDVRSARDLLGVFSDPRRPANLSLCLRRSRYRGSPPRILENPGELQWTNTTSLPTALKNNPRRRSSISGAVHATTNFETTARG